MLTVPKVKRHFGDRLQPQTSTSRVRSPEEAVAVASITPFFAWPLKCGGPTGKRQREKRRSKIGGPSSASTNAQPHKLSNQRGGRSALLMGQIIFIFCNKLTDPRSSTVITFVMCGGGGPLAMAYSGVPQVLGERNVR